MSGWIMNDLIKKILKTALPAVLSLAIGLGSAGVTGWLMLHNLDSRVAILEKGAETQHAVPGRLDRLETTIERHEKALDRDFARHEATVADISHKTDDQEKRLTRLEALFTETQAMLSEIRSDVKVLLRGGQQ